MQQVATPWLQMKGLSSSYVQHMPLGVVLIIGVRTHDLPWQRHSRLLPRPAVELPRHAVPLAPDRRHCRRQLCSHQALGGVARLLGPARRADPQVRRTPVTAPRSLDARYLDKECFRVVEGGVEPTTELLRCAPVCMRAHVCVLV